MTAIVDTAEHEQVPGGVFALIAMATHGRTGLKHQLMGSVTEQVLDHTRLPLLIVRPHELLKEQATTSAEETVPHAENGKPISWHFLGKSKTPITN